MAKIGLIGIGRNGEAFANKLLPLGHEIYLLNRTPQRAYGVMEDLIDGYPHCRDKVHVCEKYDERFLATDMAFVMVKGDYEYSDFKSLTDLRMKGLPRDGYLMNNVASNLRGYKGHVIVVSNPIDLSSKQIMIKAGLDPNKVLGYGSNLDTWRGQNKIAETLGISLDPQGDNREQLKVMFVGEHGDKAFGLWSQATYRGRPLSELGIDEKTMQEINNYVRRRGVEIILKKYDTTIGTVQPIPQMVDWIMSGDESRVIPISVYNEKLGIFYGIPISKKGDILLSRMPENLSPIERENLEATIEKISKGDAFAQSLFVDKQVLNLLYIDDQFDTLQPVARAIKTMARKDREFSQHNKVEVHVARTTTEAKGLLYSTVGGIDVLVTDQRLIGDTMNGIDFVNEEVIPNHPFTVPVILSGQASEDDLKRAIGPSFGGYIQKPLDLDNPEHWVTLKKALQRNEEKVI